LIAPSERRAFAPPRLERTRPVLFRAVPAGLGASADGRAGVPTPAARSRCALSLAMTLERETRGRARIEPSFFGASVLVPVAAAPAVAGGGAGAGAFSEDETGPAVARAGLGFFVGLAAGANGRPKIVGRGLFVSGESGVAGVPVVFRAMTAALEAAEGTGGVGSGRLLPPFLRASEAAVGA
jgi:hypothetical protein